MINEKEESKHRKILLYENYRKPVVHALSS